jgi:hypothetical protein
LREFLICGASGKKGKARHLVKVVNRLSSKSRPHVYFRIRDFKYVSQYRPIETSLVRTSPENEIARPQKTAQCPISVDAQTIHRGNAG